MGADQSARRRAYLRCCAALLGTLGVTAAFGQSLSAAQLYERLEASVWVVRTFDKDELPLSQGSAVVIGLQSLVTNCHVLRKAKRVEVTHGKARSPATLELWDTARDLCQLKAAGVDAPSVALGDAAVVVVGQPVYALGTPAGMELTLSAGLVSALRHDEAGRLVAIQTSAAISKGSSGGGLFDDQGRLVGITTAYVGGNAQNLNLALPVTMVRELGERHAAAQAAKPAPSGGASVARTPAVPKALAGQWSGEYRCGAYVGTGKVANPNPWNVTASMSVGSDGSAVIVRGDAEYSETVSGQIQADLSTVLKGRGAFKAKPGSWSSEVVGRFVGAGNDYRFDGHGQIGSENGVPTRLCTVQLTRNAI